MVTGNEYIFPNIDDALEYVLENEQEALALDKKRQVAPCVLEQPTSSFEAWNDTKTDSGGQFRLSL